MTNRYLYITLLAILGFNTDALSQSTQSKGTPRLVISITIDQLRTDYLEAFTPLYSEGGFKRLLKDGMVFSNVSYPFAPTDRASAIAAISTGTTPYYNSIVGNRWLNRETLRPMGCVDDPKFTGMLTAETASPSGLSTSTLGDELKVATGGKALVYAIAPYRDAAVLSAGHAADCALWIDDVYGDWCSSIYYLQNVPSWLKAYNDHYSPGRKISDATWEPTNDISGAYNFYLQTENEKPFKHKFSGYQRFSNYKQSALVNADVTGMALQCITTAGLGSDRVTDLLCLTYYAGSFAHQSMTESQMELQDTYVRLDQELNTLIENTTRNIGAENVLFVITSTGYSEIEPADYNRFRIPTGTLYMSRTANLMNIYLGAIWGQDNYVETIFRNQIFLNHKLLETKKISIGEATGRAQEIIAMMSGVRNVYTSLQLLTSQSPQLEKIRNAFNPQRCGDIIIEAAPGWKVLNEDTQESEMAVASYTQFPIIIFGAGTQAEHIQTPVTTDRIAPTIARSIRIRAPNACSSEPLF
ncbi:MAG: alkaline phosphatase family protein [Prevotella sp.]|nr:alkaline phosphatase family protein [Prevotella sp.]